MPELPEIETIKRIIEPQITGQKMEGVDVLNAQVIAHPSAEIFAYELNCRTVTDMSRRGKYLTMHLDNGDTLTVHLRMTGQLLVTPLDFPIEKHTHLLIYLSNGLQIRYIDVRRFGRFWYLKRNESDIFTGREKLGLEPFDGQLTLNYLMKKLGKSKKPIKEVLHDQAIVAGIGNIYSDEILFAAKVYPEKKCMMLRRQEWERLVAAIPEIMCWGIETNQMTPEEYLAGMGKEYRNMPYLKAYGHAGQPCPTCGTVLEKITIGGRSSCYCPACQRSDT